MNKLLLLFGLLIIYRPLSAQSLTPAERQRTIDATLALLNKEYVFPEVAKQMEDHVLKRLNTYATITDGQTLATQLTNDLRTISHDKHLSINYSPTGFPDDRLWNRNPTPALVSEQKVSLKRLMHRENFGILNLSVLRGNLGYLSFKLLAPPEEAGDSYIAAMNYLSQTDALIVDLRQCRGAISQHAIPLLCSCFFSQPTHLTDFYWRHTNRTTQSWTYAQVPGRHYGNKPIYILTSRGTFSGAEELTYDLKNLKRATVVGDTTGGGANGGGTLRISEHFVAFVPAGRAINPITKTNWEGVGVVPDTLVRANSALWVAQRMALRTLLQKPDLDPDWQSMLAGAVEELHRNAPCYIKQVFTLAGYPSAKDIRLAGSFNGWSGADRLVRRGMRG